MKKRALGIILSVLCVLLLFSACGGKDKKEKKKSDEVKVKVEKEESEEKEDEEEEVKLSPEEGTPFTTEAVRDVTMGPVTVNCQWIPFESPYIVDDIFSGRVAAAGDRVWILTDGKLKEYQYANDAVTFVKDIPRRSRMPMAAAYLGYADDNSPFRDQVRTLLKNGKYEEQYSFLADVPKENYISYSGEEVYAIVPQSTQYAMKVESFDWDENANAMVRDTLYISQKAAPVILKCNLSELSYNVVITLTKGTETFSYSPSLSLMDGALYAYNLDGMEIYDFTLYDNLEIPVWNEGGECGGCGDPEGYGAPLEAAGEEPGLIGQWISTELKNQSGQNITYGMYFGDYQYFEFQYGQMGHDLECWSGTFEVTDQFRNGELVVHYVLYTPDGIREGEFYTMVNYGEMLVTEGSGDAIFPFTDASTEWFYSY